jgi:hypothetical protein
MTWDWTCSRLRKWRGGRQFDDSALSGMVVPGAGNRLVAHMCAASAAGNMNVLFGLTMLAFHRYHDIALVGHRCSSIRRILKRTAPIGRDSEQANQIVRKGPRRAEDVQPESSPPPRKYRNFFQAFRGRCL